MAKTQAIKDWKSAIEGKALEDLVPDTSNINPSSAAISNPAELTAEHVELIAQLYKQGVPRREIKRQVKHSGISTNEKGAKLGLTWKQLDSVLDAINRRIAELTVVNEEPDFEGLK